MKIRPIGDRILIRIIKIQDNIFKNVVIPEHITIGGSAGVGEIVGLGQGYLSNDKSDDGKAIWEPLESKVGEKILFNAKAGLALSKKFRLIRESEVIAKLSEDGIDIGDELLSGDDN